MTMTADQQTILFEDSYMLINSAVEHMVGFQLKGSRECFSRYTNLYGRDAFVESALEWIDFAESRFEGEKGPTGEACARLCRFWQGCEEKIISLGLGDRINTTDLKKSYFRRIVEILENNGLDGERFLDDEIPSGFLHIQTGEYERAIETLQACLPFLEGPKAARLYGYLGDAYVLLGDETYAREHYFEALLISPAHVDWRHFQDETLRELKENIASEQGMTLEEAAWWLPAHACIEGIFEPRKIGQLEIIKSLAHEYLSLTRNAAAKENQHTRAGLFIRSIILCDNQDMLRMVKGIDFIDIRRGMKEIDAALFNRYLKSIEARRSTS